MITAGVDVGSVTAKAALYDALAGEVLATAYELTGWTPKSAGEAVLDKALQAAGIAADNVSMVIATGYGRVALPFADATVTEISCHARGGHHCLPSVRTVIDIGGQDSKAISVDETGHPRDFAMNDKCAAGTGRFLQVMSEVLGVQVDELGELALQSQAPSKLSSVCTVFAESEVVGLIADGVPRQDIAAGLCASVAGRVLGLVSQVGIRSDVLITGGVAHNVGVFSALKDAMEAKVMRTEDPQMTGAIGAAIIASERVART